MSTEIQKQIKVQPLNKDFHNSEELHVLVVDDDSLYRKVLTELLHKLNYKGRKEMKITTSNFCRRWKRSSSKT
jgi:PleD family two-component response regulator